MTQNPKVSIILTSYNHEKYLRESIESVLNQTYSDFDFIIWDDGSTDGSWEIIKGYSDPRIQAFRNTTDQHGAPIRSVFSEIPTRDYIAIHHSDDIWEPEKLEKQVAFLNKNSQIGAVFSNALIIGEQGELFEDTSHFYYKIFDQPNRTRYEWLNYFFHHGNVLCHPSVLIRKACYDDCGLYRYGLAQLADFDMWVRLCLKYDIYVMPEKLIRFRVWVNAMNASGSRPKTRIRHTFEIFLIYENFRNIKTPEEFLKIFPVAKKYFTQKGYDLGFALGMVALDADASNVLNLFGLQLLFETQNNLQRAKKIKELYEFTHNDFIALTGKYDVFSIELIPTLWTQLAEIEQANQSLSAQVTNLKAQIEAVYASRSWQITAPIRAIITKLRPIKK